MRTISSAARLAAAFIVRPHVAHSGDGMTIAPCPLSNLLGEPESHHVLSGSDQVFDTVGFPGKRLSMTPIYGLFRLSCGLGRDPILHNGNRSRS